MKTKIFTLIFAFLLGTGIVSASSTVRLLGTFTNSTDWTYTDNFTVASNGLSASLSLSLEVRDYWFGVDVDGKWHANSAIFTADNPSSTGINQTTGDDMKLEAIISGKYTFVWTYATNTLTITYPDNSVSAAIGGIYYTLDNNNMKAEVISNPNGYKGYLSIPSQVKYKNKSYNVKSIGNYAFKDCTRLYTITLGNGITSIGNYAFQGCSNLTSATIPSSVTSIGSYIFRNCTYLTDVYVDCGDIERIQELLNPGIRSKVKYAPLPYTITVYATNGTVILPSNTCESELTAVADPCYHFVRWSDGNRDNPRTIKLTANITLTAEFAPNQYSIEVTCNKTYGYIEGQTGRFNYLTEHVYEAVANYGYHFTQWSDGNTDNPRTITLTQDTTYTAEFAKNEYTIKDLSNDWQGYISGIGTYEYLDEVILTPVSNNGYYFVKWSDGNKDNPRTITLTQDTTFTAVFAPNQYRIDVSYDETYGSINGKSGRYDYQTSLTYEAIPNYGYHFDHWDIETYNETVEYKYTPRNTYCVKFSVPNNWTNPYAWVWATGSSTGAWTRLSKEDGMYVYRTGQDNMNIIAVPDGATWTNGQTKDLEITESCCYSIDGNKESTNQGVYFTAYKDYSCLTLTDSFDIKTIIHVDTIPSTSNANPLRFRVLQNQKIIATFAPNKYTIEDYSNQDEGYINGVGTYDYLSEITITAVSNYGYHFTQWSDGNTKNPRTITLTQDTTFAAEFASSNCQVKLKTNNSKAGIISGAGSYEYLSTCTIAATANYGYHFVQWSTKDAFQNILIPATYTLPSEAYSIAAALASGAKTSSTYTIVGYITGKYGSYSNSYYLADQPDEEGKFIAYKCTASANVGDRVIVKGYLTNYKGTTPETTNGASLTVITEPDLQNNPFSFVVTNDIVFNAIFDINRYQLTVRTENASKGSVSGGGTYQYLSTRTITATPKYGYHFTQWSDGNTKNPRTITLTQDTTFIAEFAPNQYSIDVSCNELYGYVEGENGQYEYQTSHVYKAVANYGYHFDHWSDGNTKNPRTISLTQDTVIKAEFAKNTYTITDLSDSRQGYINGRGSHEYLDEVILKPTPYYGYHFTQWSDGKTDNSRTIVLTQDTTFAAEFAIDKSGTCGANNALTWEYDDQSQTLTISGNGALTANYTFGLEAPTQMTTLVIGDGVTAIGDNAFKGMSTIHYLFIGANVASIGNNAFAECRLYDITSYATNVPIIKESTFDNVGNKQYIYLYVPVNCDRFYQIDTYWGEFYIEIKSAQTTTTNGGVTVVPTDNTAEISWPTVANAAVYEIEITKDGNVLCVLKFNANGQLEGISFAPGRNGASYTKKAQVAGFKFIVTGLTSATQYGYMIAAKNAQNQMVDIKSGTFTTTGGIVTDIHQIINDQSSITHKILRDGQVLILRGDKTYTLQGQEVR